MICTFFIPEQTHQIFFEGSPRSHLLCPVWVWKGCLFSVWAGGLVKGLQAWRQLLQAAQTELKPSQTQVRTTYQAFPDDYKARYYFLWLWPQFFYWLSYANCWDLGTCRHYYDQARSMIIRLIVKKEKKKPFPQEIFWLVTVRKAQLLLITITMAQFYSNVTVRQCQSKPDTRTVDMWRV